MKFLWKDIYICRIVVFICFIKNAVFTFATFVLNKTEFYA